MGLPASYDAVSREALSRVFDLLDRVGDATSQSGVVKADVPGTGTYVLSRQPYRGEIWLSSAVSGPHHFKYVNNRWINREGRDLLELVSLELPATLE